MTTHLTVRSWIASLAVSTMLVTACGAAQGDQAAVAPDPVATQLSGTTTTKPPPMDEFAVPPEGPFDLAKHPAEKFDAARCIDEPSRGKNSPGIYGPGENPVIFFAVDPYESVDELVDDAIQVLRVRIQRVAPGSSLNPIDVEIDVGAPVDAFAMDLTQVEASVEEVLLGDAKVGSSILITELGCLLEGVTASTTPGAEILFIASDVEPGLSPDARLGSTFHTLDWMEIDADGNLLPRRGRLGAPIMIGFLEDGTLKSAREAFER